MARKRRLKDHKDHNVVDNSMLTSRGVLAGGAAMVVSIELPVTAPAM